MAPLGPIALLRKVGSTPSWLRAPGFLAQGDTTPVAQLFETNNADRIRWVLVSGLETVELSKRARMIIDAIRSAQDNTVLCDLIRTVLRDLHPEGATDAPGTWSLGEPNATPRFGRSFCIELEIWRGPGKFEIEANPRQILWFWWGSDPKV